ncbi:MAG TPA: hypothetical protein ENO19_09065, partial [Halothiobacillaceae bacterium]|nr:hypothetical protein [Halothiobacillaceae bacterium]
MATTARRDTPTPSTGNRSRNRAIPAATPAAFPATSNGLALKRNARGDVSKRNLRQSPVHSSRKPPAMHAHIYKSRKNPDMYLFVEEGQDLDMLDAMVRERLGELEFVMELDLSEDRQLARTDTTTVRDHIEKLGFH